MRKIYLMVFAALVVNQALAQDNPILNYNGHWYMPGDNMLDKEALRYQQLIKEKSAFDTLSRQMDKYVTREQFAAILNDLNMLLKGESIIPANSAFITQLNDYIQLVQSLKTTLQGNDDYRRQAATASQRIITARREGWSNDMYTYVLNESRIGLLRYLNSRAGTDNNLKMAMMEVNLDPRYQGCTYNIAVDSRMMADPDMQMFICDRVEYILGADIYRYRETTPGVVANYDKRKKESADLTGWLLQRVTQDKVKFVIPVSYMHNPGDKPNESRVILPKNMDWYVFLFYKGFLYYSDALPKCEEKSMVSIMYKP